MEIAIGIGIGVVIAMLFGKRKKHAQKSTSYKPDWAITFKGGSVKHIYFVAETKGDTSDIQLREVERAKIECARRHFDKISNDTVKYSAVSTYAELMTAVQS